MDVGAVGSWNLWECTPSVSRARAKTTAKAERFDEDEFPWVVSRRETFVRKRV